MTCHSVSTALGRIFSGKLIQCGPTSRDSLHTRYAPPGSRVSMSYQQLLSETQPTGNRTPSTLIHILDDDSLLIIFSLCRPIFLDQMEIGSRMIPLDEMGTRTILDELEFGRRMIPFDRMVDDNWLIKQGGKGIHDWWWHRLVQVCRRWRYLVLGSASYLRLSLLCASGTPVADMLAHSLPLPIVVDHSNYWKMDEITAEDEEGLLLALQHRDRVLRIRLTKSISILQRLILALDGEFPILEFLFIEPGSLSTEVTENVNLRACSRKNLPRATSAK